VTSAHNDSLFLYIADEIVDDDDSALNRTQDTTLLRRQDSEPVAEMYLANRSSSASSLSSVHRSHSYTDNIASAVETATASAASQAATATAASGRSEVHSRPRSASALTRPRVSTVEGQSTTPETSFRDGTVRRLRVCKSSPSTTGVSETTSRTDADRVDPEPTSSTGEDSGSDDTGGAGARSRLNQRRAVRAERRYHTADTIHDIDGRSEQNNAIHKRLSLNYSGANTQLQSAALGEVRLRLPECSSSALSCESLGSFPSSSGVSSTASLYRANDDVADDESVDVDSASAPTKFSSPDDGHRRLTDAEAVDESTERGSQCQTAATLDGGGLTAAQRLQLLVAERRQLNHELLFMNPALEAS